MTNQTPESVIAGALRRAGLSGLPPRTRESLLDVFLDGAKSIAKGARRVFDEAEAKAQFNRGIDKLIREAKAEALEEAAGEIYADPRGWRLGVLAENAFHAGAHAVYDALRARAAEMREVGGDDVSRGWVPSGIYESDAMNPYREGSET